jgi:Cysteine-rich CWC
MNTTAAENIENTCPLCGQENLCAMVLERETGVEQAPCWCAAVTFDADLLTRVPAEKRNLACICEKCAQSAKSAPI